MILLAALLGCAEPLPPVATSAPLVPVERVASWKLDAVVPTDVLARADDVLVLDGYAGRVLRLALSPDAAPTVFAEGPRLGSPVRMSAARDGGVWLVDPGEHGEANAIVHLDAQGLLDRALPFAPAGEATQPVAIVDLGDNLVVSDRIGHLHWLDPTTGESRKVVDHDADGDPLQLVVDLGAVEGGFYAVDVFGPRVHRFAADGTPGAAFGQFGAWAGRMFQPKAAAPVAGGWLVADSTLGAVQAFDPDGKLVGLLAANGEAIPVGHAMSVRGASGHRALVLDGDPARLDLLVLPDPLPPAAAGPRLRQPLLDPQKDPGGDDGAGCMGCHDGLVRDDRRHWDPKLHHHPVGEKPERALPAVFPLDDQGRLACSTCHSPHGVVRLDEARAQDQDDEKPMLVRHASEEDPFLRLGVSNDELCLACHEGTGHAGAAGQVAGQAQGHPTGAALLAALDKRGDAGALTAGTGSCMGCHDPHGATGPSLTRAPTDGRLCAGCHEGQATRGQNHPLERRPGSDVPAARQAAQLLLARDGGPACLSCHDLVEGAGAALLRQPADGGVLCLACHSDRVEVAEGPHRGVTRAQPFCLACHDPHGAPADQHLLVYASAASAGDPDGCRGCHAAGGRAHTAGNPGKVGHPVDGRRLADGELLTCLSCHDAHAADKPEAKDCEACHAEQRDAKAHGGHGGADGPTCVDCHPAHEPTPLAKGDANPASNRCLACHAQGAGAGTAPRVAAYEHPAPVFKPDGQRWEPLAGLTLYGPDGAPVSPGKNGALTCESCHVVHGPDGKADHLRRADGWQQACSSCHGEEALVLYRYFHRPDRRETP